MSNYPKGSEWRRWDLHVHTPASFMRDEHSSWEDYLSALEAAPTEVCAVAITDYGTIEGYKKLVSERRHGHLANFDLILPNVELRLAGPQSSDQGNQGVDIHFIFNSDAENHVENIERYLNNLKFEHDGNTYGCSPGDFIRLGRALDGNLSDEAAKKEGYNNFRPGIDVFKKWFKDEKWLKENCLVALSNSDASELARYDGYNATSSEIRKFADIIFSSNLNDRTYFLGQKEGHPEPRLKDEIGGIKPCVHGCDKHKAEELFKVDHDRFCWIKADPTFKGLKQIIYEPKDRVWIGQQPPDTRESRRIISKLNTKDRPDWLSWGNKVELNPGLVCVIGNKGSGKTGFLDFLASAARSFDSKNEDSFIKKAEGILRERQTKASLTWLTGADDDWVSLASHDNGLSGVPSDEKVTYLTQQFVDDLCAIHKDGDKLSAEIEKVVFEKIPEEERLGSSDFEGLRQKKLDSVMQSRNERRNILQANINSWSELQQRLRSLPQKRARLQRLENDLKNIVVPATGETDMQDVSDKIDRLTTAEARIVSDLSEINSQLNELAGIRQTVERQTSQNQQFFKGISAKLEPLGFPSDKIAKFELDFAGDPQAILNEKENELNEKKNEKTGGAEDQTEDTLMGVRNKLLAEREKFNIDQALRLKIEEKLRLKNETQKNIDNQRAEIDSLELEENKLENYKAGILDAYAELFETYKDEEAADEDLYSALKAEIHGQDSPFGIGIVRDIKTSSWSEKLFSLINKRSAQDIVSTIDNKIAVLEGCWQEKDAINLREEIWPFLEEAGATSLEGVDGKFRQGRSYEEFLLAMFDLSHVNINYSLEYNKLPLKSMSPGSKGLAMMILYLQLNEHDRRPLLVDQPEENLDNESIYNDLRRFIRDAKKRRQIIMVTHNPNLVVNTDADQVIVMEITTNNDEPPPTLSLTSGAIENPEIRQKICSILEGGEEAFKTRENRYELPFV